MRAYLLATLERDAVVGAATATVLKEAMADMMCVRSRCVKRAGERVESIDGSVVESGRLIILSRTFYRTVGFFRVGMYVLVHVLVRTCGR